MPNSPASSSIPRHFLTMQRSLSSLDRSLLRLTAALDGVSTVPAPRRRPTWSLSPRARAALKLQGRYMGYIRQPKQKPEVRAVKGRKGIGAAIERAQMLAGKRKAA